MAEYSMQFRKVSRKGAKAQSKTFGCPKVYLCAFAPLRGNLFALSSSL